MIDLDWSLVDTVDTMDQNQYACIQNQYADNSSVITRPSFQEETDIVLAWVFSFVVESDLHFKAHASTSKISRDRFSANSLA